MHERSTEPRTRPIEGLWCVSIEENRVECQERMRSLRYVRNAAANSPLHKGHCDLISDTCWTYLQKHALTTSLCASLSSCILMKVFIPLVLNLLTVFISLVIKPDETILLVALLHGFLF